MQNHSDFFPIQIQADHEGKGFKCDICPLTLKDYTQLRKHMILEHNTDKKYECKFCGKRMKSIAEVEKHERRHQVAGNRNRFRSKTPKTKEEPFKNQNFVQNLMFEPNYLAKIPCFGRK